MDQIERTRNDILSEIHVDGMEKIKSLFFVNKINMRKPEVYGIIK
jgi:hypothetical protein